MIEDIKKLIETRNQLAKQAYSQYRAEADKLISTQCTDVNKISYTLDFMLDFCFDDSILQLYRRLCRHLYYLDPHAAADYVNHYREMWDEEGEKFGNGKKSLT